LPAFAGVDDVGVRVVVGDGQIAVDGFFPGLLDGQEVFAAVLFTFQVGAAVALFDDLLEVHVFRGVAGVQLLCLGQTRLGFVVSAGLEKNPGILHERGGLHAIGVELGNPSDGLRAGSPALLAGLHFAIGLAQLEHAFVLRILAENAGVLVVGGGKVFRA